MTTKEDMPSELLVPLNDVETPSSRQPSRSTSLRQRRRTNDSEELSEKVSKLKIDMKEDRKRNGRKGFMSPTFRFNAEMSIRVAAGVLIASFVLLKEHSANQEASDPHKKQWLLFPKWYYLGGLSYCAVAVIFSAKTNVGATTREVWQAFCGVGMALVYNIILFAIVHLDMAETKTIDVPTPGFTNITRTFNSVNYFVNTNNFYKVLPWIMIFTVVVLIIPIEANTRKFALANNLYFALTIINPMDPGNSKQVKYKDDSYFDTPNVLKNLELYFLVGFAGTLISFFIMFIPYPIFAIKRLIKETKCASIDIADLLNIIIDSYCFKNKNVEHMNFLRAKLHRKFEEAQARHSRMLTLLEDTWWEQLFGFHYILHFNRSIFKNYIRLFGSLLADLRTLNWAMQLEQYGPLHTTYMKSLQREIYITQLNANDVLEEISDNVHNCVRRLELQHMHKLETQMEQTLRHYRASQNRILRVQKPTLKEVEGNVPLNLFLFSLNSYCSTLLAFQDTHNKKNYDESRRAISFVVTSVKKFFVFKLDRLSLLSAFKVTVAIFAGIFIAVFVYGFNHTTPASVAYVMGAHIGGSFSLTVNRVGGVVAGSVVPSVLQFFANQVCWHSMNIVLSDFALFVWVAISMYVRFSGGYGSYAGVVSAFISAGILLKQPDSCNANQSNSSLAIGSYSSMAMTSVGIILFILIELALCPESASSLLRENIQHTLRHLRDTFDVLFDHHMSGNDDLTEDKMEELRKILQIKVPSLISEQKKLLEEADTEPSLWKPQFSKKKYEAIIHNCERLLSNNSLLFKLVRWFNYRVQTKKVDLTNAVDIRNVAQGPDLEDSKDRKWIAASNQFEAQVDETFDILDQLFSKDFMYADTEETAVFMQMKEAFRLADKDGSGEIDADEVAEMLMSIFAQSGCPKSEIESYVEEFMEVVDKDKSGMVSFEEFMEALENGLTLEVEVYNRKKPKVKELAVAAGRASRLSRISERRSTTSVGTPRKPSSTAPQTPPSHAIRPSVSPPSSPVMRRQHDVLNIEDFSLGDMAGQMRGVYVQWLMENNRFETVTMEELLLLNCLVSGAEGIARNLTTIEEIVVSH